MKHMKGLYLSLVLTVLAILSCTTILDDAYSGLAMLAGLCLFLLGTRYVLNAKQHEK